MAGPVGLRMHCLVLAQVWSAVHSRPGIEVLQSSVVTVDSGSYRGNSGVGKEFSHSTRNSKNKPLLFSFVSGLLKKY